MDKETQEIISGCLEILKSTMKKNGLILGIVINKANPDDSRLAFVKKDTYQNEKPDGIQISLAELNKGLI
jgi:hypothetical protein